MTESLGPTNTREYVVAVKFRSKRLATGRGHSIQEAEMNAAANALEASEGNSCSSSCFMFLFVCLYLPSASVNPCVSRGHRLCLSYFPTELFPQLNRQKRVIERSVKKWEVPPHSKAHKSAASDPNA